MVNNNKLSRNLTLISLILAGEAIFFLPFVLPRIFRPTLLAVFEINNTELGSFFSVYGVVAMVSYFFGGPLADRFPARSLMVVALSLTAFGGMMLFTIPQSLYMKMLYGFWGMTTILLFWAALIRATREWGGALLQGRAFGWLEGGRGLTAAIMATLGLYVFSSQTTTADILISERIYAFRLVILVISGVTLLSAVLVWIFVPKSTIRLKDESLSFNNVKQILAKPSVWLLSVIIVCAYVGYKITDDFSLYAKEVMGYSEVKAVGVGTSALWMRAFTAFIVGITADRLRIVRVISVCFILSLLGGFLLAIGVLQSNITLTMVNLTFLMIGIYGVRALYFALIHQGGIPLVLTGTAVGIVSIIGFTPDVFMSPWMGSLLDNNPGAIGHQKVFLVLSVFSLIGFIAIRVFSIVRK
ncbi:MAG TPA: MFS transporter [Bacteroidales bacterium]|nr:MFS transporter [Bacteroidales bacterium]